MTPGHQPEETLRRALTESGLEQSRLVVGVSGGSDSVALLLLLHRLRGPADLCAAYIDHGLRPQESVAEERWIRALCRRLQIRFETVAVATAAVAGNEHRSLEEAARLLRYRSFEELREKHRCEAIAVAHTADDQVETFFVRLVRGTALPGLCGMRLIGGCNNRIFRPLLSLTREDLRRWLRSRGESWREDSSNSDRRFLRNRIRLDLLPLLENEFNPAMRRRTLQLMKILHQENSFLAEAAASAENRCVLRSGKELVLDCQAFAGEHPALQRRIVESCCLRMGAHPASEQIEKVRTLILNSRSAAELHLENGLRVETRGDEVWFHYPLPDGVVRGSATEAGPEETPPWRIEVPAVGEYVLEHYRRQQAAAHTVRLSLHTVAAGSATDLIVPGRLAIDFSTLDFPLELRGVEPGDRFTPCASTGSKKVARYLAEKGIPPRQRRGFPLLCRKNDGRSEIIAVIGLELEKAFRLTATSRRVLIVEMK